LHQEQEALRLTQELAHLFTRAAALEGAARLHQLRREAQAAQAQAEAAMTISSEHGFTSTVALDQILRGWAPYASR
jgi:hypothetical protein